MFVWLALLLHLLKYGGDTDNWMWPGIRNFALLRVYTAPDGTPAEYSEENIPLKPSIISQFLWMVCKGDYAMIMGFLSSTDRYLTSFGIQQALDQRIQQL